MEAVMKKIVAIGILLVILVGLVPGTAQAGAAASAALGLGAFAVFNQIIGGVGIFGLPWAYAAPAYYPTYYAAPVYSAPAPMYYFAAPSATYAPPSARAQTEVVYPHGKYVLRGDGVRVAYRWVWIPSPPPPPPAPPAEIK
jgi:hypothetical protein